MAEAAKLIENIFRSINIILVSKIKNVFETSSLYGKNGKNFVYTIMNLAKEKKELRVVGDQIGSPTWTVTLAEAIAKIIPPKKYGLYHVTDKPECGISWFEFAKKVVELNQLDAKVIPIKEKEFPLLAKRPKNSVLDLAKVKMLLKEDLPFWKNSLKSFFSDLYIE